jgi:hypothetical protein
MTHSGIEFYGTWPEMLRAEVEDLILQYDHSADPPPSTEAAGQAIIEHEASSNESIQNSSARKRFSQREEYGPASGPAPSGNEKSSSGPWIAQRNPSPTGPRYAVGRSARNGQEALGPVLCDSGEALLDKLRHVLNTRDD